MNTFLLIWFIAFLFSAGSPVGITAGGKIVDGIRVSASSYIDSPEDKLRSTISRAAKSMFRASAAGIEELSGARINSLAIEARRHRAKNKGIFQVEAPHFYVMIRYK